jgi:glycogen debranching enzyme
MLQKDKNYFWDLGKQAIQALETETGILASGREELYGCIFGRDSLITALKLLRIGKQKNSQEFLPLIRKILLNLVILQGKEINIESGEQPGKCIHEFRPTGHEHLTKRTFRPWYVYEDQIMRNYDSIDATPLLLITLYRFWQATNDEMFLNQILPAVEQALEWQMTFGDSNGDGFIDYELSNARTSGGLVTQNWMDSEESVFHETGDALFYPLAPVEVQAYAYMAYRLWANYFTHTNPEFSVTLHQRADTLKRLFNEQFPTEDPDGNIYIAFKLDGHGTSFRSVRSNMGHVLWASLNVEDDSTIDCILKTELIPNVVKRLMMPDMFEPKAGIRTLSSYSARFDPNSYHNGSIWPHDNALIAEGFEIHGFKREAELVYKSMLSAIENFGTPIELFVYDQGGFGDYHSDSGQTACKTQAWSAAAILDASSRLA